MEKQCIIGTIQIWNLLLRALMGCSFKNVRQAIGKHVRICSFSFQGSQMGGKWCQGQGASKKRASQMFPLRS